MQQAEMCGNGFQCVALVPTTIAAQLMPRRLTDRQLKALKLRGKRYDVWGTDVRGLGVRVSDNRKTFILSIRLPTANHSTRLTLGEYGDLSLEQARDEARAQRKLIRSGIDPRAERQQRRLDALQKQQNSFLSVAEAYFAWMQRQQLRLADEFERATRRELVTRWSARAVTSVKRGDVLDAIDAALDDGSTWRAHHLFSYAHRLFDWAIEQERWGLEHSPCDRIRPARYIGEKQHRTRVLTDDELRSIWARL
jgi:Arm domain-containing DNA-binding protein